MMLNGEMSNYVGALKVFTEGCTRIYVITQYIYFIHKWDDRSSRSSKAGRHDGRRHGVGVDACG